MHLKKTNHLKLTLGTVSTTQGEQLEDTKKNKAVHTSVSYDPFVTGMIGGRIPDCYFGHSTVAATGNSSICNLRFSHFINILFWWTLNELWCTSIQNMKGQINNTKRKVLSSDLRLTSQRQTNKSLDFEPQNSGPFLLIPTFTTCSPQSHSSQDQGKCGLKTILSDG